MVLEITQDLEHYNEGIEILSNMRHNLQTTFLLNFKCSVDRSFNNVGRYLTTTHLHTNEKTDNAKLKTMCAKNYE